MKPQSAHGMQPSRTNWTCEAADCLWRRRKLSRGTAERPPSAGRREWRGARSFAARRSAGCALGPGSGPAQGGRSACFEQGGPHGARRSAPIGGVGDHGSPDAPAAVGVEEPREVGVALRAMNSAASANTVATLLVALGYSRQVNRKTKEGSRHTDRDGQFQHINRQVIAGQAAGQPAVSSNSQAAN